LREAGLNKFRLELLDENAKETAEVICSYQALLSGEENGEAMWTKLQVDSRLGVVEGTLEV